MKSRVNQLAKTLISKILKVVTSGRYVITGPISYHSNHLTTAYIGTDWFDEDFRKAYAETSRILGWTHPGPWRVYLVWFYFREWIQSSGPTIYCEFGVDKGFTTLFCLRLADIKKIQLKKDIYLFDSFEGINVNKLVNEEDKMVAAKNNLLRYRYSCFDSCVENFRSWDNVHIIKGWLPEGISAISGRNVGLFHLDLNCSVTEVQVLELMWSRRMVVEGCIGILDDYNWVGRRSQKKAIDEWLSDKHISVLSLPMGSGLIRFSTCD